MIVDVVHKKIDVYSVVIFEQLVTRNHHGFIKAKSNLRKVDFNNDTVGVVRAFWTFENQKAESLAGLNGSHMNQNLSHFFRFFFRFHCLESCEYWNVRVESRRGRIFLSWCRTEKSIVIGCFFLFPLRLGRYH